MENQEQTAQAAAPTTDASASSVALTQGRGGILGVKAGMTQIFDDNGDTIAVTVIDLRPNKITQIRTKEKDGYIAVQVAMDEKKAKNTSKAEQGHAKKVGATGFRVYREFRLPEDAKTDGIQVGATLSADFVKVGDYVDLTAISKGKGFQGVMKRYNYAGGMDSHGASISHRQIGSIGNRADPAKVFKGKKMAGQMGNVKTTVQNVKVVGVDKENGTLLVHGSVPGPRSGIVAVRKAIKKPLK